MTAEIRDGRYKAVDVPGRVLVQFHAFERDRKMLTDEAEGSGAVPGDNQLDPTEVFGGSRGYDYRGEPVARLCTYLEIAVCPPDGQRDAEQGMAVFPRED